MQSVAFTNTVILEGKTAAWMQIPDAEKDPFIVFAHYIYHYSGFKYVPIMPPDTKIDAYSYMSPGVHTLFYTATDKPIYQHSDKNIDIVMIYTTSAFDKLRLIGPQFWCDISKNTLTQPFTLCAFGRQDLESATYDIPLLPPVAAIVREYMQPYYVKNEYCYSHAQHFGHIIDRCDIVNNTHRWRTNSYTLAKISSDLDRK